MTLSFILNSCSAYFEDAAGQPDVMKFKMNYPVTRATDAGFEAGNMMGIYVSSYNGETSLPLQISGNYANNVRSVYDGTEWSNTPLIYWTEGLFDVYAYYPYDRPGSVDAYSFNVALDQSSEKNEKSLGGYEASDFLWAKAEAVSRMDLVPLTFKHCMSRLVINLVKGEDFSGDIPSDAVVRIHSTVPSAFVDLSTGVVTKDVHGSYKTITAKRLSESKYAAIIVPQRLDNKLPLIEVITKNVSYLVESKFVFRYGTQHTVNITLNNNPDKVKIEIGGEIEGWE